MLLAVYLMVMGVPTLASLTCSCSCEAHGVKPAGGCCCAPESACELAHPHGLGHLHFDSMCRCNHSHDTEVVLYTFSSEEESRHALRCVVFQLPAVIACEVPIFDFNLSDFRRIRLRAEEGRDSLCPPVFGLRAPPVVA